MDYLSRRNENKEITTDHHSERPRSKTELDHRRQNQKEDILPHSGRALAGSANFHPKKTSSRLLAKSVVIPSRGVTLLEQVGD